MIMKVILVMPTNNNDNNNNKHDNINNSDNDNDTMTANMRLGCLALLRPVWAQDASDVSWSV